MLKTMPELTLHSRKVESVFQLLGDHENDITYSIAWGMASSPRFLGGFLSQVLGVQVDLKNVVIRLQQIEEHGGITDIEIESPGEFFIIVEAKRGWNLPDLTQLQLYATRPSFTASNNSVRRLVVLTECSREYAFHRLGTKAVD